MSSFATAHYIDIVVSIHMKIATINRQILLKTSFNHYQQNISERVINGQDEQLLNLSYLQSVLTCVQTNPVNIF